ncbi:serine hydrolase domain-containing protein [Rhodococcus baikonurensis]|uniref:serine hydrolase domain-containing protein n=1 Tax=Rhodococcus baikonurensis TaxID=172041 RepID=UPI00379E682F
MYIFECDRKAHSRRLFSIAVCVALVAGASIACSSGSSTASPASLDPGFSSTGSYSPERPVDPVLAAKLDAVLAGAVEDAGIPGAIVGLWSPEGSYVRATGVSDTSTSEPMKTNIYHRIGSVTKTFTVTALLQLADESKIGLDDPISRYISGVKEGDNITLRHLAGMQSGLVDYTENEQFVTDFLVDPQAPLTPQQLLSYIDGMPLKFRPGAEVSYSNTNTVLLGLVVEKVSGKPLREVIKSKVTDPLGMSHTVLPVANEFPSPHAQGYTDQTSAGTVVTATDWNPSWGWAAGAMTSNLADMKIWVPALAKGSLLKPETQRERLRTVSLEPGSDGSGYGLGIFNINGWIGHNGSLPGYKTVAVYLPEKEMTLVVMVNSDVSGENTNLVGSLLTPITQLVSPGNIYE